MKPKNPDSARSNPWPMLVWLLLGPMPLFLVLAFQAHRAPAHGKAEAMTSRPMVFAIPATPRLAPRVQAAQAPARQDSEKPVGKAAKTQ
ncbi:MAG: hypothetical protein LAP85_09715 [Acidobacteriia bacterium]|nr:hypothetical protein [Terriglobia bacterium]